MALSIGQLELEAARKIQVTNNAGRIIWRGRQFRRLTNNCVMKEYEDIVRSLEGNIAHVTWESSHRLCLFTPSPIISNPKLHNDNARFEKSLAALKHKAKTTAIKINTTPLKEKSMEPLNPVPLVANPPTQRVNDTPPISKPMRAPKKKITSAEIEPILEITQNLNKSQDEVVIEDITENVIIPQEQNKKQIEQLIQNELMEERDRLQQEQNRLRERVRLEEEAIQREEKILSEQRLRLEREREEMERERKLLELQQQQIKEQEAREEERRQEEIKQRMMIEEQIKKEYEDKLLQQKRILEEELDRVKQEKVASSTSPTTPKYVPSPPSPQSPIKVEHTFNDQKPQIANVDRSQTVHDMVSSTNSVANLIESVNFDSDATSMYLSGDDDKLKLMIDEYLKSPNNNNKSKKELTQLRDQLASLEQSLYQRKKDIRRNHFDE
ncbi:NUP62 [Acrasis kona]|uniref:NUP62 n=1 Tax=Acrasis kona TaxID=1008807 RepID=A0AAW2ZCK2_9EUKA